MDVRAGHRPPHIDPAAPRMSKFDDRRTSPPDGTAIDESWVKGRIPDRAARPPDIVRSPVGPIRQHLCARIESLSNSPEWV
jgi:hypothetical protein